MGARKRRKVCGVGVNDAEYEVRASFGQGPCPIYTIWKSMLTRCYSGRYPSYADCSVCDEWHLFSNFKCWAEKQDYQGKQLDKDILQKGNKVYSPTTCMFVPIEVNCFIQSDNLSKGVTMKRHKFQSQCRRDGVVQYLGIFDTYAQAHECWRAEKERQAVAIAAKIDDKILANAVEKYFSKEVHYGLSNS